MDNCEYEVSFFICTYNSALNKVIKTIESCIMQKELRFEIIISDDGSDNNMFSEYKDYFERIGFAEYKLVSSSCNTGIVQNVMRALNCAQGKYVKGIAPGDYLVSDTVVRRWLDKLIKSQKKWSFSEAYYYKADCNEKCELIPVAAHPQIISPYIKGDDEKVQFFYSVCADLALGAALLSEKDVLIAYLNKIAGDIKYSEDFAYRLMVFDGILPFYFEEETMYYEFGSGISTVNNLSWRNTLINEKKKVEAMMCDIYSEENDMYDAIRAMCVKNRLSRFIRMPYKRLYVEFFFRRKRLSKMK